MWNHATLLFHLCYQTYYCYWVPELKISRPCIETEVESQIFYHIINLNNGSHEICSISMVCWEEGDLCFRSKIVNNRKRQAFLVSGINLKLSHSSERER